MGGGGGGGGDSPRDVDFKGARNVVYPANFAVSLVYKYWQKIIV